MPNENLNPDAPKAHRTDACCADWEPQTKKLNAPLHLAQARNPALTQTEAFDFKAWDFCPWCGASRLASPRATSDKIEQLVDRVRDGIARDDRQTRAEYDDACAALRDLEALAQSSAPRATPAPSGKLCCATLTIQGSPYICNLPLEHGGEHHGEHADPAHDMRWDDHRGTPPRVTESLLKFAHEAALLIARIAAIAPEGVSEREAVAWCKKYGIRAVDGAGVLGVLRGMVPASPSLASATAPEMQKAIQRLHTAVDRTMGDSELADDESELMLAMQEAARFVGDAARAQYVASATAGENAVARLSDEVRAPSRSPLRAQVEALRERHIERCPHAGVHASGLDCVCGASGFNRALNAVLALLDTASPSPDWRDSEAVKKARETVGTEIRKLTNPPVEPPYLPTLLPESLDALCDAVAEYVQSHARPSKGE